jgi:predicted Zn-dependent protease
MTRLNLIRKSAIPLILFLLAGCATVPYTERSQFMMVSEEEEVRIGTAAFEKVKSESDLNGEARLNALIQRVGRRIAGASGREALDWEFIIIDDRSANAFALPGGKVAFNTGILPLAEDEAGVAVVMGHEVAHVLARHGAERLSQSRMIGIGKTVLSIVLSSSAPGTRGTVLNAYGIGTKLGVMLPFSRSHESEADNIGLSLMARAGYDPSTAIRFWTTMLEKSKGSERPELLATHPGHEKRIERLKEQLPAAMLLYRAAIEKNPAFDRAPELIGEIRLPPSKKKDKKPTAAGSSR